MISTQILMWFSHKEVAEKHDQSQELPRILDMAHKICFSVACAFYLLSTCFALPYFAQPNSDFQLANHFLYNFAILLAISEGCVLASKAIDRSQALNYLFTLAGCILMGVTALYEEGYNQGAKYMVSSFMLSVSNELKIIRLLLPNNRLKTQRNRFMLQLTCCLGSIIFFFSAAMKETGMQSSSLAQLCPAVNFLSGVVMSFSIFYLYRSKEEGKGSEYMGLGNVSQLQ